MGFETLVVTREEAHAVITLNRPPANAIRETLVRELNAAVSGFENDDSVRCLIIPGFGGTQRMPRLIGRTKALEFMILGTQIPAAECLALGLVNRLSKEGETLNDARALARQISKRPPIATRLILEVVDDGLEAP